MKRLASGGEFSGRVSRFGCRWLRGSGRSRGFERRSGDGRGGSWSEHGKSCNVLRTMEFDRRRDGKRFGGDIVEAAIGSYGS